FARMGARLPDIHAAHWLLRLLLAAIIIQQGFMKTPISADDAAAFGVPVFMWTMAALGEILAGVTLIVGGAIHTRIGDVVTRIGGLMLAVIVASVLVWVYWAPPLDMFELNQLHLLLLAGGLYFALRGNAA
ncbi:MAG: hypothetical protein AAGI70_10300, partial [Pseudomonadota bacterium]